MKRLRLRLLVLGVGAALSAASAPTLSAWTDTTSNPSGTVSAIPDWVAPTVDRVVVQKTQGGTSNFVKPGGTYHVCSQIAADTGNPASGLNSVVTDVGALTSGLINQILNLLGGGSPCAGTDNRDSGQLTVNMAAGAKTISLQVKDNANNTRTATANVTVDGTAPTATSFSTTNKAGGIAGRPETGDTMTFTFSEPIDPHSVISGWDGTGTRTVYPYFVDQGANRDDRLMLYNQSGQLVPLVATTGTNYIDTKQNSAGANFYFTSTIAVSGNSFVITFGVPNVAGQALTDTNAQAATWPTSGAVYDRAANNLTASTITQSGTPVAEF